MKRGTSLKRRHKFGAQRSEGYDSQLERRRHSELKLLERAGDIRNLKHHPPAVFMTDARIQYGPDFFYEEAIDGTIEGHPEETCWRPIYEETKGFETADWRIKRKLWKFYGPAPLRVMVATQPGRIRMKTEIVPRGTIS